MSFLNQVIDTSLKVPGIKVDRRQFLSEQLSPFYSQEVVKLALDTNPTFAKVPDNAIDTIAKSVIKNHTRLGTTISFAAGLPGGLAMLGTVPLDLAQFFSNVLILAQKLAYLYGWPDISDEESPEVFKDMLALFLGVMMGVSQANKALGEISRRLAVEVLRRVPRIALTKYAWFNSLKIALKWVGVKLTKDSFARVLSKGVPIVGGFVSGGITYVSMSRMSGNLVTQLKSSSLFTLSEINTEMDANENFEIEDLDIELTVANDLN